MAVASIWRRAWMRSRVSHTTPSPGGDNGGGSLQPTGGDSITSGTTTSSSTTTATTSGSAGGQHRDFHAFMVLPTAPVAEDLDVAKELEEDRVKKLKHIKGLVVEFCGDNLIAVERWLSELDVSWVLHLAEVSISTSGRFQYFAERWILALQEINKSISTCFESDGWCSQDQEKGGGQEPPASEFVQLVKATVLKMLPFLDAAIAAGNNNRQGAVSPAEKLQVLIDVHDAISNTLEQILSLPRFSPCAVESTDGTIGDLLCAEQTKLDEAICNTISDTMDGIMAWMDKGRGDPHGSSDIHKVTHFAISYTKVMWANYMSLNRILHGKFLRGEYAPEDENVSYVTNLIMEMVCSTEDRLARKSQSWFPHPHESLRFLFLINNSYFMSQQLHTIWRLGFPIPALTRRIDDYINGYLQASWAPVLKCLNGPPTPHCLARNSSPLTKFETKFYNIYSTQKLWKVPDPDMRKRMRKTIVKKVIPVFTKFLEDNSISTPGVPPKKAEEMLGELFEG